MGMGRMGGRFGRRRAAGGGGGGGGLQALRNAMERLVREGVLTEAQVERIRQTVKEERRRLTGGRGDGEGW